MVKRLLSKWYLFVVWAAISVFLWVWIAGLITRPTAKEKLSVFVCSENCGQEELVSKLQSVRPEYVEELGFKWVGTSDSMFKVYYDAFAVYESDVIIMPADKLSEVSYVDFYELDEEVAERLFGVCEFYKTENRAAYGIKIDAEKSLGKQTENAVYYLFFNKKSLHLGELSGSRLDGAITFAKIFI